MHCLTTGHISILPALWEDTIFATRKDTVYANKGSTARAGEA